MKFPSYVPEPAAKFLTEMIEGNGSCWPGYAHLLEKRFNREFLSILRLGRHATNARIADAKSTIPTPKTT